MLTYWQPISTAPNPDDENFLITDGIMTSIANKDNGEWWIHD